MRFAITASGGGGEQQLDGPVLVAGQWYHVAVTLEGNLGTLYVNGLPVAANPNMTLNPSQMGTTTANFLGNSQYSADPRLRGRIDDLRIYSVAMSAEQIARMAGPVVMTPAAASESTSGGAVALSVLGSDLTAGEALLRYTWTTVGSPPGPVSFSLNGTNAAQQTVANFSAAGDYVLQATIANPVTGLTATSTVTVSVTLAASVQAADAALETWSLAGRFADGQIPRGFRPPLRAAWPARLS